MNPRISVIVPLYNVEAYVGECIASLQVQTFRDFEAILVDSGSCDDTVQVARRAVGEDARFSFLSTGDRGQSVARNAALDVARGEYLLNLDSDDYYLPDTLERLLARADEDSLDMLFFSARTFYETEELARRNPEPQANRPDVPGVMTGPDMYVAMEESGAFRPSACMFLLRRSLVEDARLRFEEGIIHEDLLFTMMAMPLARRAAFLNECFYQRRMRPGSTMTTARGIRNIRGHLVASMRMEDWICAHAGEYRGDFVDAYCRRIHFTWMLVAHDVGTLDREALAAFRDSLAPEERVALNLHGIELAAALDEVLSSTTYKVGRALLAAPTALKDRIAARRNLS